MNPRLSLKIANRNVAIAFGAKDARVWEKICLIFVILDSFAPKAIATFLLAILDWAEDS